MMVLITKTIEARGISLMADLVRLALTARQVGTAERGYRC
jgi:hypothetical protein